MMGMVVLYRVDLVDEYVVQPLMGIEAKSGCMSNPPPSAGCLRARPASGPRARALSLHDNFSTLGVQIPLVKFLLTFYFQGNFIKFYQICVLITMTNFNEQASNDFDYPNQ